VITYARTPSIQAVKLPPPHTVGRRPPHPPFPTPPLTSSEGRIPSAQAKHWLKELQAADMKTDSARTLVVVVCVEAAIFNLWLEMIRPPLPCLLMMTQCVCLALWCAALIVVALRRAGYLAHVSGLLLPVDNVVVKCKCVSLGVVHWNHTALASWRSSNEDCILSTRRRGIQLMLTPNYTATHHRCTPSTSSGQ